MPRFNIGDRVRVSLSSHSPYRGQTGVVEEIPSNDSQSSMGSSEIRYLVRFDYRGLHPAVHFLEEDLEDINDEIGREETPAPGRFDRWSQSRIGSQISQVSTTRKYIFGSLIAVLVLAGIIIGVTLTGTEENPPELTELPGLEGSSNNTPKLVFTTEPVGTTAGSALPVQPVVKIVDSDGNTVTTSTAPVTLTVTNNRADLYGTTTVNAVNGTATFTDIAIALAGSGYSLTAISPGLTSSFSNVFDIDPAKGIWLDFITEPVASGLASRFSVAVAVRDIFGNISTNSTAEVTVSITPETGEPGAVLSGTTTQEAIDGVAFFKYLSIIPEDSKYKLTATSPGMIPATTSSFNVAKITESQAQ
ncbi:MAG: hypothetical protein JW762_17325 [Dehalococcoidales bacterium]|nr:hypothetical protein [Dehalococcoidales bacterium]